MSINDRSNDNTVTNDNDTNKCMNDHANDSDDTAAAAATTTTNNNNDNNNNDNNMITGREEGLLAASADLAHGAGRLYHTIVRLWHIVC